ncbi:MAG: ribose-phosphate pyrophosphokinase [Candidatus Diapherotrites archaeon]|nr:ribose-phosphate pyrophosphokinase [Candidatus Diapherotrites archaeon]
MKNLAFFAGNSNPELAKEIAKYLKIPLGKVELKKFADGENYVNYTESIRGKDVYILQSTCNPVNDNLMELLIMVDAAKRAAAERITCIIPFYGYAKLERKARDREPITAKLVAELLQAAGADAVVTMDLHADAIQGFFDIRADFLYASGPLVKYLKKKNLKNIVVVSPDVGSSRRARAYAKRLHAGLAIIDKRRPKPNVSEVLHLIGDVKGKTAVIIDDEINTGGTLVNAAKAVLENGAKEVYAMASHAVFAGPAPERLEKSALKKIIVTNSIPQKQKISKVETVSIAPLLGEAIRIMNENKSMSKLLNPSK